MGENTLMANNEIKPFATGANANVTPQAEWENLPALLTGFSSGKASSAQVNKAIRQASFVAATLAQFIADQSGEDVRDDGDQAGLVAKMLSAINKTSQPLDETLVALAALTTTANKLPYFTGNDTAALTDLTATGRGIIGKNSKDDVLSYLGLGEAAKRNVGSGNNQLPDMGLFSSLLGTSGYQKLPSGLIIQWGASQGSTSGVVTYSFPIPFPNAILAMTGSQGNAQAYARGAAQPLSGNPNSQYQVSAMTGGSSYAADTIRWFAVGY